MENRLSREQLIELVQKIMKAEGTEEELDRWQILLKANVADPEVSDLIFYSDVELSPEEVVDRALSYKPIQAPARSR